MAGDHIAAERTVSDQPTEQVGEIVAPLLGKRHRAAWSPLLAYVATSVGTGSRRSAAVAGVSWIEQSDPVIGVEVAGCDPAPVGGPEAVVQRVADPAPFEKRRRTTGLVP